MSSSTHPSDGDLRALLDGELADAFREELVRHAAGCPGCRERLLGLERDIGATEDLLGLLPAPELALSIQDVMERAALAGRRRSWLIAASVMLALTATAGATVGRPLVRAVAARVRNVFRPSARAHPSDVTQQLELGLAPGPETDLVFRAAQTGGELRVSLADTSELVVRSSRAVPYRVFPGGVMVENDSGTASFDVILPRTAPHVRILVAGRGVLEKDGSTIITAVPPDSAGRYVLPVR